MSVIQQYMVALTFHTLPVWLTCLASAADWCVKGRAMCYNVHVIMHIHEAMTLIWLSVVVVGNCVPLVGLCLFFIKPACDEQAR